MTRRRERAATVTRTRHVSAMFRAVPTSHPGRLEREARAIVVWPKIPRRRCDERRFLMRKLLVGAAAALVLAAGVVAHTYQRTPAEPDAQTPQRPDQVRYVTPRQ